MEQITLGNTKVSRFILGSNPFSGFSHQSPEMDLTMKRYYTTQKIKETLHEAQRLGINTVIARSDHHIMRILLEFWDEGGTLQWFSQTCPEVGSHETCVNRSKGGNAKACHIHGGVMDHLLAQGKLDEVSGTIRMIRDSGMLAGIAAHNPDVIRWAEDHLDVDYYMCSYYNSESRLNAPTHDPDHEEWFHAEDREIMANLIQTLSRPAIHYKIIAAGRNNPADAIAYTVQHMRPTDAVCIGVYTKQIPDMLERDINLFNQTLSTAQQ